MSIPIGFVILLILAIFGGGILAGWTVSGRRASRAARRAPGGAAHFLNALPQPALLAGADSAILESNPGAGALLAGFGELPPAVGLAVRRVIGSQIPEALELPAPGDGAGRLQVSISPLGSDADPALVLFGETKSGSGRTQVYKRLMEVLAHELRTPLTAIVGHVEILSTCSIEEETLWRRSLGFISGEVERLAILVEDLLSLSRLDHIPVHLQVVNLRLVAEQALSGMYEQAEKQQVTLVLQAPPELPRAQADPDRIRQVFINLLHNAIKYAPGSVVTVQLAHADAALQVEVRDTGPGIASEDLPHIFEPLFRSREAPAGVDGTGLGLAIVRLILDQHNAPVSVNSPEGRGVCFRFSLPAASAETGPQQV